MTNVINLFADDKGKRPVDAAQHQRQTIQIFLECLDHARKHIRGLAQRHDVWVSEVTAAAHLATNAPPDAEATQGRTVKELRHWRNGLVADGVKASTINRLNKALKAALNLALRMTTGSPTPRRGRLGLPRSPRTTTPKAIWCLSDDQRRDIVAHLMRSAPNSESTSRFIRTGARSGQIALLDVGDLHAGKAPKLMMPSS